MAESGAPRTPYLPLWIGSVSDKRTNSGWKAGVSMGSAQTVPSREDKMDHELGEEFIVSFQSTF